MNEARYREAERDLWQVWGITPRERRVRLPRLGVEVRVLDVGDAEAPPALFVHGASVAATSWADLAARLVPGVRCLLLDRPGCGLSEPVPDLEGVDDLAGVADVLVVDVLDALGIDRAHLVSNSMGGYFALRGAAAHPARVDRLLHFGWALGAPPSALPLVMRAASVPGLSGLMARMPVTRGSVRAMLKQVGLRRAIESGGMRPEGIAWNVALSNHTDTRINEYRLASGSALREQIERLALPPDVLGRIEAPVHVVFGVEDIFGTPATMQALVDGIPDATLEVIEEAGHAPWLDDLDHAADVARRFLGVGAAA